ncbi:hypothetical protein AYI70_g6427 [Smittium culicis]|uniref:Uncharacterized protein n=1 Tax=Smittium culicis TaxID=133412 RepID=A0A1R1XPZ0_9FUNG|nr:hypothetical protein AYI70_g6427 [Smittium culicis]
MASRPTEVFISPGITTKSNNSSAGLKKRKIFAVEKQELASYAMESQRCILKEQALSDIADEIIVPNQLTIDI